MARPTSFTEDTGATILARLSKGEPLAQICRDEGMPDPSTFRRWVESDYPVANVPLSIAYARARDDGFDAIAIDALAILDDEPERVVTTSGEDRSESRIDSASVQRAKNRFEGRLKLLAKWDPKRYGDRTLLGSDPDNPLPAGVAVSFK